jgi:hypothetical protein
VVETNLQLLQGGAYLQRLQYLRHCLRQAQDNANTSGTTNTAAAVSGALDSDAVASYVPEAPLAQA